MIPDLAHDLAMDMPSAAVLRRDVDRLRRRPLSHIAIQHHEGPEPIRAFMMPHGPSGGSIAFGRRGSPG